MDVNEQKALKTIKVGKKFSHSKIIILMGLPGSGKSFVADYLNKKYGYTIISGENISNALFGNNIADFSIVYKIVRQLASKLLMEKHSIVIDGTNLKFSFRKQIYDEVCMDIKPILIYLLVDDKTARKRIDKRGEGCQNIKDIKSQCSKETFIKFKEQTEEPTENEPFYRLVSDENLLGKIDSIISKSIIPNPPQLLCRSTY